MNRIPLMPKYFTAIFLLFLFLCTSASAITVTASPQAINVAQGMSNPIQIFYQATQIDAPTFSAISSQGRFETPEGALLGTANSTVTITVVNTRGSATESVVVPAGILRQALEMNLNRLVFRRTFTPTIMDLLPDTSEVQLRIVPPSAAQFSLTRMELAFNQPVTRGYHAALIRRTDHGPEKYTGIDRHSQSYPIPAAVPFADNGKWMDRFWMWSPAN